MNRSFIFLYTSLTRSQIRSIAILFLDAVQRMFRITTEVEAAKHSGQGMQDVRTETSFAARKF